MHRRHARDARAWSQGSEGVTTQGRGLNASGKRNKEKDSGPEYMKSSSAAERKRLTRSSEVATHGDGDDSDSPDTDSSVDKAFRFQLEEQDLTRENNGQYKTLEGNNSGAHLVWFVALILLIVLGVGGQFGVRHWMYDVNNVQVSRAKLNTTFVLPPMRRHVDVRYQPDFAYEFFQKAGCFVRDHIKQKEGGILVHYRSPVPSLCFEFSSDEFSAADIVGEYVHCTKYMQEFLMPSWVEHMYYTGAVIPCEDYDEDRWGPDRKQAWRDELVDSQPFIAKLRKQLWGVHAKEWDIDKAGDAVEIVESACVVHKTGKRYTRVKVVHVKDIKVEVVKQKGKAVSPVVIQVTYDPIRMTGAKRGRSVILLPSKATDVQVVFKSCEDLGTCLA